MKPGERIQMAMSKGQPVNRPGGFATQDHIPNVQFVRDKLAVQSDWKESVDYVQEYEVIKEVLVLKGPIGPQLDPKAGEYLPGGASQIELQVPPTQRMDHLKPIGTPRPIK